MFYIPCLCLCKCVCVCESVCESVCVCVRSQHRRTKSKFNKSLRNMRQSAEQSLCVETDFRSVLVRSVTVFVSGECLTSEVGSVLSGAVQDKM